MRRALVALMVLLVLTGCEAKPQTAEQRRQQCITHWINAYPSPPRYCP